MPSYEASIRNLLKAANSGRWHRPRPWRSKEESEVVRRFVFWWLTCRERTKPSGRSWARQLGISHTWLQKLVREFEANPARMWEMQRAYGDPTVAQLTRAQEESHEMRKRADLRRPRRYLRADE